LITRSREKAVENVTLLAAFGAGFISFISPCVLPIVPGYLTVITGLDITSEAREGQTTRIIRDTSLFILGFTIVFVLLGIGATSVGSVIVDNQDLLVRISGLTILAMALYLLGSVWANAPWLYQEKRFYPQLDRFGPFASPVAGVAFGLGWTPCIGPVLTSVLAVAATRDGASEGALLLAVYSLGLGVPFLLTGLLFGRLTTAFTWFKRHLRGITLASGLSLAGFGVLLVFNRLTTVTSLLQDGFRAVGLEELIFLG
jgi:cytochrome c-type biogenesis protein